MASLGLSKTRWSAIVSSTTPKLLAKCPPFLPTTVIISLRISFASWLSWEFDKFFISSGELIFVSIVKNSSVKGNHKTFFYYYITFFLIKTNDLIKKKTAVGQKPKPRSQLAQYSKRYVQPRKLRNGTLFTLMPVPSKLLLSLMGCNLLLFSFSSARHNGTP